MRILPGLAHAGGTLKVLLLCRTLILTPALADTGPGLQRYATQHAAAIAALTQYNPASISENREYGGYVFFEEGIGYGFSVPQKGGLGNVTFAAEEESIPDGATATASWHTHGAAVSGVVSEIFSPQDIRFNQTRKLDGYLATPSGAIKYLRPDSRETELLGSTHRQ